MALVVCRTPRGSAGRPGRRGDQEPDGVRPRRGRARPPRGGRGGARGLCGPPDRGGPMTVKEAVESGDLDRLVRLVDRLCGSRDWNGVVELRDRCRHAIERGLQLWPAAEFAEYRL